MVILRFGPDWKEKKDGLCHIAEKEAVSGSIGANPGGLGRNQRPSRMNDKVNYAVTSNTIRWFSRVHAADHRRPCGQGSTTMRIPCSIGLASPSRTPSAPARELVFYFLVEFMCSSFLLGSCAREHGRDRLVWPSKPHCQTLLDTRSTSAFRPLQNTEQRSAKPGADKIILMECFANDDSISDRSKFIAVFSTGCQ